MRDHEGTRRTPRRKQWHLLGGSLQGRFNTMLGWTPERKLRDLIGGNLQEPNYMQSPHKEWKSDANKVPKVRNVNYVPTWNEKHGTRRTYSTDVWIPRNEEKWKTRRRMRLSNGSRSHGMYNSSIMWIGDNWYECDRRIATLKFLSKVCPMGSRGDRPSLCDLWLIGG